jgi:hypothetical protein
MAPGSDLEKQYAKYGRFVVDYSRYLMGGLNKFAVRPRGASPPDCRAPARSMAWVLPAAAPLSGLRVR